MSKATFQERIRPRLDKLYGSRASECAAALSQALNPFEDLSERFSSARRGARSGLWDQRDVVLITYGDQVQSPEMSGLSSLHRFLKSHQLTELINSVHLLPFSPYSSDDGFSVIDYRRVADEVGDWTDVKSLGDDVDLMFDLVLNHCSQHSLWFQEFLLGNEPYDKFFITADPEQDLSMVTRPRSLPLLSEFETRSGTQHVWTTFSADQVDLNFAEPVVLAEMLSVLLYYVEQGARIVRLDAIAYLWKELGTSCIHLWQTHEVVKLMREVLDEYAPHVILLTETNVPHIENVSYFGDDDEAHMVYQFSLPPLLLDAFLNQDASVLVRWLGTIGVDGELGSEAEAGKTTFFNFTASHDGIGVRPLEGLVSGDRIRNLADHVLDRRGYVSTKRNADGSDSPYELNITYLDALGGANLSFEQHAQRFLASQAVMLSMPGIPGVYFHSLVGSENDLDGTAKSGVPRRINRHKYSAQELRDAVSAEGSLQSHVFNGYKHLLAVRIAQPAFHPNARCLAHELSDKRLLAFQRISLDGDQSIWTVVNLCRERVELALSTLEIDSSVQDLLTDQVWTLGESLVLRPNQAVWLSRC